MEIDINTLEKAISKRGAGSQKTIAIEEMSELITVLVRSTRSNRIVETKDIITEIADVLIVINQLALLYGKSKVQKEVDIKMYKLKRLIED